MRQRVPKQKTHCKVQEVSEGLQTSHSHALTSRASHGPACLHWQPTAPLLSSAVASTKLHVGEDLERVRSKRGAVKIWPSWPSPGSEGKGADKF